MLLIEGITNESRQRHLLPTEVSDVSIDVLLVWSDTQSSWFADIVWGTFAVYGLRVCSLPNLLAQWAKVIPFGISVVCSNGQDPFLLESFANGTAKLYILNASEAEEFEAMYG